MNTSPASHPTPFVTASQEGVEAGWFFWLPALVGILVGAFLLRYWELDFGLPGQVHPDEATKWEIIKRLLAGERPDYFLHPGLMVNSVALFIRLVQVFHPVGREFQDIIYPGRLVIAAMGSVAVVPAFLAGWGAMNRRAGLFAAWFVGVVPILVVHSRYVKEDIPLCLAVLCSVAALIWAVRLPRGGRGRIALLLLAGGLAGICSASKFVGAVMIPAVILAGWRSFDGWRGRCLYTGGVILLALLLFVACSPQVLHAFRAWEDFRLEFQRGIMGEGRPSLQIYQWPDLGTYFFRKAIGPGMSWVVAIPAAASALYVLRQWRERRSRSLLVLCALAVLWYLVCEITPAKRGTDSERYAIPAVGLLCITAGVACDWLLRKRRLYAIAIMIILTIPLARSIATTAAIKPDTMFHAQKWLKENQPRDQYYLIHAGGFYPLPATTHTKVIAVDLNSSSDEIRAAIGKARAMAGNGFYTERLDEIPSRGGRPKRRLDLLRSGFPYVKYIRKPWWMTAGFHNPTIEIRMKEQWGDSVLDELVHDPKDHDWLIQSNEEKM